jgi:TolA-binding protein
LPAAKSMKDSVLYWTAEVHFKGNSFAKAGSYYKMIIDEFPKSNYVPAAYYSLGWCLLQDHKYAEALEYFKTVEERFSREPQAKDSSFKIVECLYNLKDYKGLKERIKNYLKIYSKDAATVTYLQFYMAEADYYLDNLDDAIQEYTSVLKANPDPKIQALTRLGQGWAYLKLKQYKEAESVLQDISPENLEKRSAEVLLLAKAMLFAGTERFDLAKNTYGELQNLSADQLVLLQASLGKADALYNLTEYKEAIDVYKRALEKSEKELSPGSAEIVDKLHYSLAWAYLKQGEFKEAIKEFQKIVKSSDDKIVKVSALCQIGDAYQDSQDYAKAQETYDIILKDYPDSFYVDYVQYQLGLTLLKASNYDGAILSFLTLKKNFPDSKLLDDATYALGLAYFQRQDYNASKEIFQKFQEEYSGSSMKAQALYLLGTSLYNLAKFQEAVEVFKNIIRLYSQDAELTQKAEYEIADCFYQMGNETEAMERFKQLRSKYPDSSLTAEIMWWLGSYYYRHNELELSRRYFSSLIQDFPKSSLVADAYYALASTFEEESNHEQAIDNFRKVAESGKADLSGQAAIAIADIYAKEDKSEQAVGAYKDVIRGYPGLTSLVYPKMADLFYKTNDFSQALDYFRKSLEIVPPREMPNMQFRIAESLQAQSKTDEAIEAYLKVSYLYSENSSLTVKALLRVAALYEDKDNSKEAANIYKRIIALNTEEAKYAQERLDVINSTAQKRR